MMFFYVHVLSLVLIACTQEADSHTSSHHNNQKSLLRLSKRTQTPHNYYDNNEYADYKSYRRQEVIHALNDNSDKTNDDSDDIDSLGKSMDATGAEIKQVEKKEETTKAKEKDVSGTTKDIIQKIKDIQDRLFKRTGSKQLEDKLKEMEGTPEAKKPMTEANSDVKSDAKNMTKNEEKHDTNGNKLTDGSKKPDRRKIIPEEVVDKILEKFQQLRLEAKHMALLETKHDAEKENSDGKPVLNSHSPYESIGPAKPNGELKNRTDQPDIEPAGFDSKVDMAMQGASITPNTNPGGIEIPIGNVASIQNQNNPHDVPKMPGMPVMFIRNGQMLVPVFGSNVQNSPMSITGNAMAQFSGNPGLATPNLPSNVVPMNSPQQLTAAFMGSMQNALLNGGGSQFQSLFNQQNTAPYVPARNEIESASSRCDIPGGSCPSPTQTFAPQQNPTNNIAAVDNGPSTTDLIRNILNAPGFPQLAARLMNEPYQGRQFPQMGESRGFNNMPAMRPSQDMQQAQFGGMSQMGENPQGMAPFAPDDSENAQGLSAGSVQFNLQHSLSPSSPGEVSMLQNQPTASNPQAMQRALFNMQQPTNPSGPLMNNPYQDVFPDRNDNMEQMQRENQMFNARNIAMNDISDPAGQDEERGAMQQQTPEQLLNYAKLKNMQSAYRQEAMDGQDGQDDDERTGPTRMPSERGGTERSLLGGGDPGSLLDKLHGAQLKVDMMGAGDPRMFSPTYKQKIRKENSEFEGSPDDLLEMLRTQNDKMFNKNFAAAQQYSKSRYREQRGKSRQLPLGAIDPSFADDVSNDDGFNQQFDVQSKSVAAENDENQFLQNRHHLPNRHSMSVLPDNFVQYKHGRMSMDSADVVNSFFRDPQYNRNSIAHPSDSKSKIKTNKKDKAIVRASISKTLPADNVELRINGKKLIDKNTLRSKIVNGKIVRPKGKTLSSKGPVQIELSHGADKRKIINILTNSKYNITEERRRTKIPKVQLIEDD